MHAGIAERLMSWLYTTRAGRIVRPMLMESRRFHRLVGWYADTRLSRIHIPYVVGRYGIDLSEAEVPAGGFPSFNAFFTRRLRPGARRFDPDPSVFCSPADAHLFVIPEASAGKRVWVKGIPLTVREMVGPAADASAFDGGSVAVFRLEVRDCHRVHFPVAGVGEAPVVVPGDHYAVTPFAGNDLSHYLRNRRTVTRFETEAFGPLLLIDIGGFCISSIVHTFTPGGRQAKGDEKSQFRYGGSSLVVCARRKALVYDDRFVAASAAGRETPVAIGDRVAMRFGRPLMSGATPLISRA